MQGSSSGTQSGGDTNEAMRVMRELATVIVQQTQQNAQFMQWHEEREEWQQQVNEVKEEECLENGFNAFMRGNPLQFHGEYDPEAAEKWLEEVEKVFMAMHCRE